MSTLSRIVFSLLLFTQLSFSQTYLQMNRARHNTKDGKINLQDKRLPKNGENFNTGPFHEFSIKL